MYYVAPIALCIVVFKSWFWNCSGLTLPLGTFHPFHSFELRLVFVSNPHCLQSILQIFNDFKNSGSPWRSCILMVLKYVSQRRVKNTIFVAGNLSFISANHSFLFLIYYLFSHFLREVKTGHFATTKESSYQRLYNQDQAKIIIRGLV